jgi:hypothetical protein
MRIQSRQSRRTAKYFRSSSLRQRVGARHLPLAELLAAFTTSGLELNTIAEFGDALVPWMLGLRAEKTALTTTDADQQYEGSDPTHAQR